MAIDDYHDTSHEYTEAEKNYVNSFDQIIECDFEIFVLYGNRDNSGPAMELQYSLQNNFENKMYVGMRSNRATEISSMIRGALDHHKIVKYEFCTVSHSSGQFTKRIMIRFLPFHLPFVLSYFFPSLIFLPSQS
ncbi:MAG: hypothetical protein M1113_00910, partial [Candidatus Thermoplasmatota archaeon]|nr:hypothetical protein [Candidatus Thermoplasmatota archaeon]